jgi:hypothetical protein
MKKLIFLLALLVARPAAAQNAEVLNFEEQIAVAANGDGTVKLSFKLNAQQFVNWKQKYGLNPSLLKRDVGKFMSQYETHDFKCDQNEMEREFKVSFGAKGFARAVGGRRLEIRLPKTWKGGDRKGTEYTLHYPESLGPRLIADHTIRVSLPEGASNWKEELADGSEKVISYEVPASFQEMAGDIFLVTALGAAGGGFALIVLGVLLVKVARSNDAT